MTVESSWPIIVGGSHRSGTSLLRRLLNGHPHIFCPPEIKFYKDLLGQQKDDPLAHVRLGCSMSALNLPTEIWLDEFGAALCRCYDIATLKSGKKRWADKNPENALNVKHWDRLLCGNMAFILVIRHPYDIIASIAETPMKKALPIDIAERAHHVLNYINSGLSFANEHQERCILVRYEHLVTKPKEVLNQLMLFLGEEYDDSMICSLLSTNHGEGLEDPKIQKHMNISTENIGRWKIDLTSEEVNVINPILSSIMQYFCYEF